MAHQPLAVGPRPARELGQVAQVLRVPEHEGPPGRERKAQTTIVFRVIGSTSPRKRSRHAGAAALARCARAARHSAGSGTLRRIQKTRSAGRIPTRKTLRGRQAGQQVDGEARDQDADVDARSGAPPRSTAASARGQVSESSDEPTAHSPPMPRAARNRKIRSCHQVCGEEREAGEERVGQDGEAQGAAAAEPIAEPAEEAAAERPADEERGLDPRALLAHRAGRPGSRRRAAPSRRARPPACRGACRGRRTASPARPRSPTSTARGTARAGWSPRAEAGSCEAGSRLTVRIVPAGGSLTG